MARRSAKGEPTGRVELAEYRHRGTPRQCIGCRRSLVVGDRCPPCQAELKARRQRRRR